MTATVGTVLRGRTVVPGVVTGEALVSPETISGWGGIDPATGTIVEARHALQGVCFTGKILVFPGAKGSSGWSAFFQSSLSAPPSSSLSTSWPIAAFTSAGPAR